MTQINTISERLHALDAVRAFALLLGIVLHATMSFQPGLAVVGWPIVDNNPSVVMDLAFYLIHVFRMATFFIIAGFFAHMVFHRRGAVMFIKDRLRRIALPLVIFWPVVIVPITAALIWGVLKINGGELPQESTAPEGTEFPLTHLWFLYVLLWIYGIVLALRQLLVLVDRNESIRHRIDILFARITASPTASLVLAIPIAIALALIPDWVFWGGIPTPDQSLRPIASSLFIYCYVFVLGWVLHRQQQLLQAIRTNRVSHLLIGLLAVVTSLGMAGPGSDFASVATGMQGMFYAFTYAIATVALSLGFIGFGLELFRRENPRIRYLADASYWMYVMHLPIVMLLQAWMMDMDLHWSIKFMVINGITFGLLLASYHWLVRERWLGRLLSGKRKTKAAERQQSLSARPA